MPENVQEVLSTLRGPAPVRPGFEDELFALLEAELAGVDELVAEVPQPKPGRLGFPDLRKLKERRWILAPVAAAIALGVLAGAALLSSDTGASTRNGPRVATEEGTHGAPDPGGAAPGSEAGGAQEGPASRPDESEAAPGEPIAPGILPEAPDGVRDQDGRLPPNDEPDDSPSLVAATGDVLAFASKPGEHWHIYAMRGDATHRRQLTNAAAHDREPDWSPDGTKIVFVRLANEGDHAGEIYVMDADGSDERFLAMGGEPQWSPDGKFIAYTGPSAIPSSTGQPASIWIMRADGSHQRKLFSGEGAAADVTWSPVGGLLAFAGIAPDLPPDPTAGSQTTNLYTMTEEGALVRRLTDAFYACNSEFSPDGTRLAFITSDGGAFDVWTMRTDGSDKAALTNGPGMHAFPHWSPDGKRIAFGLDPDGEPHWVLAPQTAGPMEGSIWSIRPDGTGLKRISPKKANDADPAYAPARLPALNRLLQDHRRKLPPPDDEGIERAPMKSVC